MSLLEEQLRNFAEKARFYNLVVQITRISVV
jgi:hypothetical protein